MSAADLIDIKVQDVYEVPGDERYQRLWYLMSREADQIGQDTMRPWGAHVDFIDSKPYRDWYFIEVEGELAGCVHLTTANEVVLGLLADYYDAGIGSVVMQEMFARHPNETLCARVSGDQIGGAFFLENCGFKEVMRLYKIQTPYVTYTSSRKGKK